MHRVAPVPAAGPGEISVGVWQAKQLSKFARVYAHRDLMNSPTALNIPSAQGSNHGMSRLTKALRRHSILPKKVKRGAAQLRRQEGETKAVQKDPVSAPVSSPRAVVDHAIGEKMPVNRFEEYFAGKDLTKDWTSYHFDTWAKILEPRRLNAWRILEIGSFEGRSAIFFLKHLPNSTLACVDPFGGSAEHRDPASPHFAPMSAVEKRFDNNLASFEGRFEKRKGPSAAMVPQLAQEKCRFDLIYVDGDHRAASAYNDAAISWPLLNAGGIMIFDDYQWELQRPIHDRPKAGIDAFLEAMTGRFRHVHRGYQVIVEKF
jgi:hypothetical protein